MTRTTLIASAGTLAAVALAAFLLLPNGRVGGHADHSAASTGVPQEAGQGAFAALSEIVSTLSADPKTNWSKVDIDALRRHLVDMNELTLNARVLSETVPDGLSFTVTGEPRTAAAIKRMVPAHATVVGKDNSALIETATVESGVVLTLSNLSDTDLGRYKALGFFGFMATGAHHQPHHLAMAKGEPVHSH
ncbi:hypothetical protein [Ahrensia sp. R2A130]|uniref:hypothetical protein n=1 Tax=Ahrensia sp. R2A130 TaxID=744979 RepID=UPI0001E0E844|nr:hypothetical protein [Ahrensia sp. R2A130]EFL90928.1 conserved hypothetical protein [Ahrensia sp. R2A130]